MTTAANHSSFAPPSAWLDPLPEGCVVFDAALRVVYCNPAFATRYGHTADELFGQDLATLAPSFAGSVLQRLCEQVRDTHLPQEGDESAGRHVFNVRVHAVPDGVMAFVSDRTTRRRREDEVAQAALEGCLPRANRFPVRSDRATPIPGKLTHPAATKGTVLIVDDEPFLRDLAARVLRGASYQVRTASSGREAIELLHRDPAAVQLIVLDLMMRDLNGWETLEALRAIRADLPVILMSGQPEEEVRARDSGAQAVAYLAKPYSIDTLVTAVERALSGG